jgi:hypothetical protein
MIIPGEEILTIIQRTALSILFVLRNADMQSTADQKFRRIFGGANYWPLFIYARQRTGGASVACAGGVYDAAAKGGTQIVAAAQSWVTLASGVTVRATMAAAADTTLFSNTPYLSLTTGSTAACTADLWIVGLDTT